MCDRNDKKTKKSETSKEEDKFIYEQLWVRLFILTETASHMIYRMIHLKLYIRKARYICFTKKMWHRKTKVASFIFVGESFQLNMTYMRS